MSCFGVLILKHNNVLGGCYVHNLMKSRCLEQKLFDDSLFLLSGGWEVVRVDELDGVEVAGVDEGVQLFPSVHNCIQLLCLECGRVHH